MLNRIGQQLGNYQLTGLLGQGGAADVYLGEHIHLGTKAAIKVLQMQMTPQDRQQFIAEAQTIANLKHLNIVRLLEFGVENQSSLPYLVMEYAPNGTLRDRYPAGTVLPVATILPYVKQVAAALQYVHDQRLVHRDVKPENMLLEQNEHILLSDFGIVVVDHSTRSRVLQDKVGTPYYMAPEQIRGQASPASDQYSLGIVVYEWLCGAYPFDGSTDLEIAVKQMNEPPPALRSHIPSIPDDVEWVVLKALAKDPQQRFASVQAFATALEQASQSGLQRAALPLRNTPAPSPAVPPRVQAPAIVSPIPAPQQPLQQTNLIAGQPRPASRTLSRRTVIIGLAALGTTATLWWILTPHPSSISSGASPSPIVYPDIAGEYNGTIHNARLNITTSMSLSINQNAGEASISGFFTVGSELVGNGPLTGTVDPSGNIQFKVHNAQLSEPIFFSGTLPSNGSMSGTYCSVDEQNQCDPQAGNGTWSVTRNTS